MNDKERAAMELALEALEDAYENGFLTGITGLKTIDVLAALREALAEQSLQKLSDFHQTMEQAGIVWDASAPVVMDSSAPKNENQEVAELRKQVAALKAVVDAWKNVEQEPVGYVDEALRIKWLIDYDAVSKLTGHKLYAAPVRTKDLTDDEIEEIGKSYFDEWSFGFARAVIAAYKAKNNGVD